MSKTRTLTPAADPPRFLTMSQFCDAVQLSRPTVLKLIAQGDVKASKATRGRTAPYRFHPDEPVRYLASMEVQVA